MSGVAILRTARDALRHVDRRCTSCAAVGGRLVNHLISEVDAMNQV